MKFFAFILFLVVANVASASDFEIAEKVLSKSGGRIIRVMYGPDFLKIDNICSGAVTGDREITTAAHCFFRTRAETPKYKETYHFDIDGVTSVNLGSGINSLKNGKKVPTRDPSHILGVNIVTAKRIMAGIPQIVLSDLHEGYVKNAQELDLADKNEAPKPEFDLAKSYLNRSINVPYLKLSSYIDGETIYLAGQGGMYLEGSFRTIKCIAGEPAYAFMVDTVGTSVTRVPRGARARPKPEADKTQFKLDRYLEFYQIAILNYCSESIVRGYSGGPQTVVRNGKVYLVGVTSQMFETEMGMSGRKIAGARVDKIDFRILRKN